MTQYESLKRDLGPIVDTWADKLETMWENICKERNQDMRLAMIIEHNQFKDLLKIIKWLHEDTGALNRHSKQIQLGQNTFATTQFKARDQQSQYA